MNLELIAQAIRIERQSTTRWTSLEGLYSPSGDGTTLAASLRDAPVTGSRALAGRLS